MNPLDAALAQRVAERDTDLVEAVIPIPPHMEIKADWPDALEQRPVPPLGRLHYGYAGAPGASRDECFVWWECKWCGHEHEWLWRAVEIEPMSRLSVRCEECGGCQMLRTAERAVDDRRWRTPPRAPRSAKPMIQDGQRLAQVAALIAERLMDRNWVQLRMDSSAHATDLIEMAAALKEFGV